AFMTLGLTNARADDREMEARSGAKELAQRGDAEFGKGRCDRAMSLWKLAEAKYHAPTILLRIARCQALMGKVVAAAATLEAIAADTLPADAPAPFLAARHDAIEELPGVRERIAELTVRTGASVAMTPLAIEIDGAPAESRDRVFHLDPGTHRVRISASDSTWEHNFTLDDGERRTVNVALRTPPPTLPPRLHRTVGYLLAGAGRAAL